MRFIRRPDSLLHRRRGRLAWLVALCCAVALSACAGGSGSSGFDNVTAENDAINRALDSQGCEVNEGLTICASGPTPTPSPTPTLPPPSPTATPTTTATPTRSFPALTATPSPTGNPGPTGSPTPTTTQPPPSATATTTGTIPPTSTPTPTPIPAQPGVDINIGANNTIPCRQTGPGTPCIFVLTFQPRGAPASAAYRVAVRTQNPPSAWRVSPVTDNSAPIEVNTTRPGLRYQIAVLLFVQEPAFVPDRVDLLADTGADFAFVTPLLTPERIAAAHPKREGQRTLLGAAAAAQARQKRGRRVVRTVSGLRRHPRGWRAEVAHEAL